MRRREFEITRREDLLEVLDGTEWGTLGLARADGPPRLVPINHVRVGRRLYFHGAPEGEKMRLIADDARASFVVVQERSVIPSYFTDPERACRATQLFRSVIVTGRLRLVSRPAEKALALNALMRKLQPEGGYAGIAPADPRYRAAVRGIAVLALGIERMSGKFKLAQNFPEARRRLVARKLRERGARLDVTTAAEVERLTP